jgi:hypothetical protein
VLKLDGEAMEMVDATIHQMRRISGKRHLKHAVQSARAALG